jgi:transposase
MQTVENANTVESTEATTTVEGAAPATPATPAKARKPRVSLQQFISAWESSKSVSEAAEKVGLEAGSVQARASKYRASGIPLKEMPRGGGAKLDIGEAQALLAKLRGVEVDAVEEAAAVAKVKRDERKAERDAAAAPAGQTA